MLFYHNFLIFFRKEESLIISSSENKELDEKEKTILRLLEEGHNTKEIAQRLGYKDRDSVGKYMRRRGYSWNKEKEKYIKDVKSYNECNKGKNEKSRLNDDNYCSKNDEVRKVDIDSRRNNNNYAKKLKKEEVFQLIQYLPTMKWIHDNKSKLKITIENLENNSEQIKSTNRLPRYLIEGSEIAKTINLPEPLHELLSDYCRKYKINQKEIFIIALIEFFRIYGPYEKTKEILGE